MFHDHTHHNHNHTKISWCFFSLVLTMMEKVFIFIIKNIKKYLQTKLNRPNSKKTIHYLKQKCSLLSVGKVPYLTVHAPQI